MIPRLHLVTDDGVLAGPRFAGRAMEAAEAGGRRLAFHLRGPRTDGRRLWSLGSDLARNLKSRGTVFLVNDRIDVALALRADGVHLGARGFELGVARALLGDSAMVGRSVHGSDEAGELQREASAPRGGGRLDFAFAGAIFATPSHPGRDGVGAAGLSEVTRALPGVPILGIGGITPSRVATVVDAGGHGVAVIRAIWEAEERVGDVVEAFLERLERTSAARAGSGPNRRRG